MKWLYFLTLLFTLLLIVIIVGANTRNLPRPVMVLYRLPGADKAGHFALFGILSFLLNKSFLTLFPERNPTRIILAVSLFLSMLVGLEEWSQQFFPSRTASLVDLTISYAGIALFAFFVWRGRKNM